MKTELNEINKKLKLLSKKSDARDFEDDDQKEFNAIGLTERNAPKNSASKETTKDVAKEAAKDVAKETKAEKTEPIKHSFFQRPQKNADEKAFADAYKNKKKEPVQIVHRDRGVAISRYFEQIMANVGEINQKLASMISKNELGKTSLALESGYIRHLSASLAKISATDAVNLYFDIITRFKDGFFGEDFAELNKLGEKIFALTDEPDNLSRLNERVKTKPRKRVYVKKLALLLSKFNTHDAKKLLDEILITKNELENNDNSEANDRAYQNLALSLTKDKNILPELKEFCLIRVSDVVDTVAIKEKSENDVKDITVYGLLDAVYAETVALKCEYEFKESRLLSQVKSVKTEALRLSQRVKSLEDEISRLKSVLPTDRAFLPKKAKEAKSTPLPKGEPKGEPNDKEPCDKKNKKDKKISEAQETEIAATNPKKDESGYVEILDEISQLKSDLENDIKAIMSMDE